MGRLGGWAAALVVLALLGGGAARGQDEEDDPLGLAFELEDLEGAAAAKAQAKDWAGAIAGYRQVIARVQRSKLKGPAQRGPLARAHYNIACAQALSGHEAEALEAFGQAVELGFWSWDHIARDADLDSIRGEPAFVAAVEKGKAAERAAVEAQVAAALAGVRETKPPLLPGYGFDTVTTDGKPLRLGDLAGKVVLVTWFWPAVSDERGVLFPDVAELVRLRSASDPQQLAIVGLCMEVSYDQDGSALQDFLAARKINFPVAKIPPEQVTKEAKLLFIDRQGRVRANLKNPRREVIDAVVGELLAEPAR